MMTIGYELGSRVFSSVRVWSAAAALTFAFCEGAGFGAFSYHCGWYDPFPITGPLCTLTPQVLLPPGVPWATFAWNLATLWLGGLFDGGFLVGLFLAAAILAIASRMPGTMAVRVFSIAPIIAACAVVCAAGYGYEVQATAAAGLPQVPL